MKKTTEIHIHTYIYIYNRKMNWVKKRKGIYKKIRKEQNSKVILIVLVVVYCGTVHVEIYVVCVCDWNLLLYEYDD